jgi:hypothetical protein
MAIDFEIIGPVSIPFQKKEKGSAKHIGKAEVKAFWASKEAQLIADKQGCYVFALQAARGFRPWYVGKATKSMAQECMQSHKLAHYNEVLFKGRKGTPVLFFVVLGGDKKKVSGAVIDEMETFFIQTVLSKHPEIQNIQKTNLPEWTVTGVVRGGKGKPKENARAFRKMMGLSNKK